MLASRGVAALLAPRGRSQPARHRALASPVAEVAAPTEPVAPAIAGETRVFVSRHTRTTGDTPATRPAEPPKPAPDAAGAPPRPFSRFQRAADGSFSRPGGAPPRPDDGGRPSFERPASDEGARRFGPPAGRGGRAGGRGGGRGGRGGRGDEAGAVTGRAATEARRTARASRKEERNERKEKKEKCEFVELPPGGLSVEALAEQLAVNSSEVIKALFMKGIVSTVNMVLDADKVAVVAAAFEVEVLEEGDAAAGQEARKTLDFGGGAGTGMWRPRAPVVAIMGHVDHGKTSLLDCIRKTRVAAGEAGGITQAIGAYQVSPLIGGEPTPITFLDTPGHEAFSAMRARGARVTDIAVICVAADDGVKPQTLEAIAHATAAGVPIVVALNKVDKEGANVERVKQELAAAGLLPEEWGGTTPVVPVSAKKGTGVDALLETLQLVAELAELGADASTPGRGTCVEAYMDRARGATATLLVQAGTLRVGDVVVCGCAHGRVRALLSDAGARTPEAGPSTPVQMLGLDCVPAAGDTFDVCGDEEEARLRAGAAQARLQSERLVEQSSGQAQKVALDGDEEGLKRLNVLLRADASGSLEAVKSATGAIAQDRVQLRFLAASAGDVCASDIDLAAASDALVLAFNTTLGEEVRARAKQKGVDVRSYDVIYALVDDVKAAMEAKLRPIVERAPLGEADVRGVFGTGSSGKVAGVVVTSGKLVARCMLTVRRGKAVVFEGRMDSLRRMKDMVKEVPSGMECGVGAEAFLGWAEGDKIEAFELVTRKAVIPLRESAAKAAEERAAAMAGA